MQQSSQVPEFWLIDRPVVATAFDYPPGDRIPRHQHGRAQLVYASTGVMTVTTDGGTWVVPPQRAVWMPEGVEHEVRCTGAVEMRTLYIRTKAIPDAPPTCRVVTVSPLLRELILRAIELPQPYPLGGAEERLVAVLLDEIGTAPGAPLHLPVPSDASLRTVVNGLLAEPADKRTLAAWAREIGVSDRTLARLFVRETGMTFAGWRQQLRLIRALEALAAGRSVTDAAMDVGYDSPSSFIAMFRRSLGTTPSQYFAGER